jgi:glycosyltransferase involved in cell wall biosynthesis
MAGEGRKDRTKLLVVGKGDSWNEMVRRTTGQGGENRIKMVDFRPYAEIPTYLAAADVCLLPAYNNETMRNIVPIKLYEYLAAGKPVIATKLPGVFREFGEGHGVVYVDTPDQVVDTAARLRREGTLSQLGAQGRAFVSRNDWNSITDAFESDLSALVRGQIVEG